MLSLSNQSLMITLIVVFYTNHNLYCLNDITYLSLLILIFHCLHFEQNKRLTHHTNISLTEINEMLTTFERALNIETILSQICLPSSSSPSLSSSMLLSNVNSSNHNSTSDISFNAISGTNDISTSNNSNELNEHVCHYTTNDDDNNLSSSSNSTSCRSNNNIDNSAIRTAVTTVNFDELDPQDENWTTPTGLVLFFLV
ncbi:hypothetical protein Smp_178790 [Schistosoma mansoni]|uniref:hypothetical protein n=1 Tax=Schistosoma mansoni TaxID=6183 RepID=UPI00022C8471|nr:hypothetical protein Smp_178790 [Schistosoma mansoni]|eukprot:XP_018645378.1 hypothetical protein Smp_178790 [Schistosoma mansoni]